ncbi:response regulator [Anaerolineales bacterium HSG6]|nr:response regulator [Anaerolineales bacterium HSG6]MDM8530955.1 response regulator [Anaerolineales bacterium HSG25]
MNNDRYILYIEDERSMFELVRQALKLSGYEVKPATSGKQGLAMLKKRKPDLLLLDLMMPGINGWDIYRKIKSNKLLADIPVIALSARPPDDNGYIIKDLPPVDGYLTKPFEMDELVSSVEKLL